MRGFSVWAWLAIQVMTFTLQSTDTKQRSSEETGGGCGVERLQNGFLKLLTAKKIYEGTPTEILIGQAHHRFSALTCNCRIILYSLRISTANNHHGYQSWIGHADHLGRGIVG